MQTCFVNNDFFKTFLRHMLINITLCHSLDSRLLILSFAILSYKEKRTFKYLKKSQKYFY